VKAHDLSRHVDWRAAKHHEPAFPQGASPNASQSASDR
jgi:hypothetical protein